MPADVIVHNAERDRRLSVQMTQLSTGNPGTAARSESAGHDRAVAQRNRDGRDHDVDLLYGDGSMLIELRGQAEVTPNAASLSNGQTFQADRAVARTSPDRSVLRMCARLGCCTLPPLTASSMILSHPALFRPSRCKSRFCPV